MTNITLLTERIKQSGYKLQFIAEQCGLTYQGLLPKLKGERDFKQTEITALTDLLKLSDADCIAIFFADGVDSQST